ncbi:hypothetical protein KQX54_008751 [Cotesia glomerata]|uniref:Uncharacterized protein n=1 Tax=Cotesia glomerata TaxID=32391 RepID=A0AAV7IMU3_COTGL|nr:hypothetical protein KQX54_008751 [Cotesia glomerata]
MSPRKNKVFEKSTLTPSALRNVASGIQEDEFLSDLNSNNSSTKHSKSDYIGVLGTRQRDRALVEEEHNPGNDKFHGIPELQQ